MAENKDYKFVQNYEFDTELLKKAFAEARAIYKERGFMRKMGYGKAPAITTVDMAKAWMSEGHPFTCDHSEEVCAEALKVLEAGRKSGVQSGYRGGKPVFRARIVRQLRRPAASPGFFEPDLECNRGYGAN